MNNTYSVYLHIFPNGKVYVGITKFKPEYRWNNGNGYKRQLYVYKAILKYGWVNIKHEILEANLSESEAKNKEKFYIKAYKSNDKRYGYNLTSGGDGTCNIQITEERRIKIIESNKNRIITAETREKIRQFNLGRHASVETKLKMSEQRKGSNNSFYGKHHSNETKRKISTANGGFNNKRSIHIAKYDLNGNLIDVYGSLRKADENGYNRHTCRNKINNTDFLEFGGFLWKILD